MDSQSISLVRTTFKAVAAEDDGPERLTRSFYAVLFTDYPGVRDFFPAAMESQRDRLVKALAYVVNKLEEPEQMLPFLAQLGRDHRKYGVLDEHYAAVGNSLVKALRNFAGNELWTDDVDRAWNEAIGVIASAMMDAAKAEVGPAVWGATVVEHREVLRDLAIVKVQLGAPMQYVPGQYVSVQIPSRPRMWRYLSPANPPNKDNVLEFHIRAVTGGWVSPAMVGHTRVGDEWQVSSPLGGLGLPADAVRAGKPGRDMLMIASGTGIAPIKAQLLEMAARPVNPKVHLFVGGQHPCDLYDLETLWRLSERNPWLTVTPVSAVDDNPWWHLDDLTNVAGMRQRITGQIGKVVAAHGNWSGRDIQIVGSPSLVQTTKFRLMAAGVPSQSIRHDPLY